MCTPDYIVPPNYPVEYGDGQSQHLYNLFKDCSAAAEKVLGLLNTGNFQTVSG